MSNCENALHELYQFLDGELTEDRRDAIRAHLDSCQPCAEPYDFEAELRMVIRAKCQEKVPQSLVQKVRQALAEAAESPESAEAQG